MLEKIAKWLTRKPKLVAMMAVLMLIPAAIGYISTRINYDILSYLPEDLESSQGEKLLEEPFKMAATSMLVVEDMPAGYTNSLINDIKAIDGVSNAIWISNLMGIQIPTDMIPANFRDMFFAGDATMMIIQYSHPGASDETMEAIEQVRRACNEKCFLAGFSVVIKDTRDLMDSELPIFVGLAVLLALVAMMVTLESTVLPFIFLASIGFAVIYNFGSNIFLGEISYITKHKHKSLMPSFDKVNSFILRHNKVIMVIFVLLFIPAYYAQSHAGIYYKLDESLPRDLPSIVSNEKLKNDFDMATSHFIVLRDDLNPAEMSDIENRMEEVKGVTSVVSYHKMLGTGIPDFFIPNEVKDMLKQGGYQLMMVNSSYSPATDAVAAQLDEMNAILKQYDENAMITGEGAMYRDLIDTTAVDFVVANYLSIACIFIIVAWAFKSITVPAVLVATIELAIFLNQGFSYFSGASTPFIAPTIISCVQLGATVDYAILMTSRFQEELQSGKNRKEAIRIAADSADASIITSALVMFCATLGVSFVSSIDLIGAICIMLARGALISACICLFVMPAVLYVCEPMFNKTTLHWRTEQPKKESKAAKALKAASEKLPARKEKAALPEKGTEQTETTEPAEAADSTKLAAESETEADAARETANV